MRLIKEILKSVLIFVRGKQMTLGLAGPPFLNKQIVPKLFNLDLHISVISDLADDFKNLNVDLVNWSISGSNRYTRKLFRFPDPVNGVNSNNWTKLGPDSINLFLESYSRKLKFFDGFIVTHTPAFSQIFEGFLKPQLIVNSTRYEAPYTNNSFGWKTLNQSLQEQVSRGQTTIWSNNVGDQEYLKYFTGLDSDLVPSLCGYTKYFWPGTGKQKLVLARSEKLQDEIFKESNGLFVPFRQFLGKNYKWADFSQVSEIFVIPYNISTMSLFEFATSGIPVAVPGKKLLKELFGKYPGVLSELSYFQVRGIETNSLSADNPNNYASNSFLDWWLDKADFYNLALMPNVRIIETLEELKFDFFSVIDESPEVYLRNISSRNAQLKAKRRNHFKNFVARL